MIITMYNRDDEYNMSIITNQGRCAKADTPS